MIKRDAHSRAKTTILVIDDDVAVRDSLKFMLELEGFRVRLYAGGEELMKERDIPDHVCLVVDQVMPGMSGLETIDAIRRRGGYHPAVLVISNPNLKVRHGAAARGVPVVEKPFLDHTLIDAIANAVALN
jgi:two-component system, LuxR family, response regulator FixJ